jgi:hypothetical protein
MYPNANQANILFQWAQSTGQTISLNEVAESYLSLNIYYHSIQFTRTDENILTQTSDVFASFGGIIIINFFLYLNFKISLF